MNKRRTKKCRNKRRTKKCRNKITKNYRNNNNSNGEGSRIYTLDGHFTTDPKLLHEGKYIFRKMTNDIGEKKICELLMNNPHKNIVKIYGIGKDYVDMELLNTDMDTTDKSIIKTIMLDVKAYLQRLGIMYIDWKLDNIGISEDGEIKLFDFDVSGTIDNETKKWILANAKPSMYNNDRCFIYNKAYYEAFLAKPTYNKVELFDLIRSWADERGIYDKGDPKTQLIKLYEETGELAAALLKDDKASIIDAIGDSVVVLTNLAKLVGYDIESCIQSAYDEISNRTGRMIDGTFVKDTL